MQKSKRKENVNLICIPFQRCQTVMTDPTNSAVHQWARINVIKRNTSDANLVAFVFQLHGIVMDQMIAMIIATKKNAGPFHVQITSTNVTTQNVFSNVSSFIIIIPFTTALIMRAEKSNVEILITFSLHLRWKRRLRRQF